MKKRGDIKKTPHRIPVVGKTLISLLTALLFAGCAQTQIIESPKTAYVADSGTPKDPQLIWSSRSFDQPFDYLGQIKARSWTYDGALERLKDAGRELRADAIIDIHF